MCPSALAVVRLEPGASGLQRGIDFDGSLDVFLGAHSQPGLETGTARHDPKLRIVGRPTHRFVEDWNRLFEPTGAGKDPREVLSGRQVVGIELEHPLEIRHCPIDITLERPGQPHVVPEVRRHGMRLETGGKHIEGLIKLTVPAEHRAEPEKAQRFQRVDLHRTRKLPRRLQPIPVIDPDSSREEVSLGIAFVCGQSFIDEKPGSLESLT